MPLQYLVLCCCCVGVPRKMHKLVSKCLKNKQNLQANKTRKQMHMCTRALMQNAITLNKETSALSLTLGFLMKAEIQMSAFHIGAFSTNLLDCESFNANLFTTCSVTF